MGSVYVKTEPTEVAHAVVINQCDSRNGGLKSLRYDSICVLLVPHGGNVPKDD
jgi:hypothetical protein